VFQYAPEKGICSAHFLNTAPRAFIQLLFAWRAGSL